MPGYMQECLESLVHYGATVLYEKHSSDLFNVYLREIRDPSSERYLAMIASYDVDWDDLAFLVVRTLYQHGKPGAVAYGLYLTQVVKQLEEVYGPDA